MTPAVENEIHSTQYINRQISIKKMYITYNYISNFALVSIYNWCDYIFIRVSYCHIVSRILILGQFFLQPNTIRNSPYMQRIFKLPDHKRTQNVPDVELVLSKDSTNTHLTIWIEQVQTIIHTCFGCLTKCGYEKDIQKKNPFSLITL